MIPERKPIVVLYIPVADFFGSTLPPSSLMAAFNGQHDSITMPDSFNGYLWFVFVDRELRTPDIRVFHVKDYTKTQYDDLRKMLEDGISLLNIDKQVKPGDFVHYIPRGVGSMENGRVKSINGNTAFVVYHCNNEWDRYQEYTGAGTDISQLSLGWINGDEPK